MKEIVAIIILFFVLAAFAACSPLNNDIVSGGAYLMENPPANFLSGSQPASESQNGFSVQYIRTDGYHESAVYPLLTVISSRGELEKYYDANKNKYALSPAFDAATEKYTGEFFLENYLVIVLLEEGSGSVRHEVEEIGENGEILISRLQPGIGTCDMAEWHVIIELKNGFQPPQFNAVFVDKWLND